MFWYRTFRLAIAAPIPLPASASATFRTCPAASMFPATTRAKASSAVSVHMSPAPTPAHIAGVDAIDRGARTSKLATAVIDVEFFDPGKNTNDIVVVFNPVAKLKR